MRTVPQRFLNEIIAPAACGNSAVVDAFARTPRALFVDEAMRMQAYSDNALPIGFGQTISKPSTVAAMTAALEPTPDCTVLEIGTGSGFQAAILARVCKEVFTVERIRELHSRARTVIRSVPIGNVRFKLDNGSFGWPEMAPFDRILCACEASVFPEELADQLTDSGIMLLPLNGKLMKYSKADGKLNAIELSTCSFVDFVQ